MRKEGWTMRNMLTMSAIFRCPCINRIIASRRGKADLSSLQWLPQSRQAGQESSERPLVAIIAASNFKASTIAKFTVHLSSGEKKGRLRDADNECRCNSYISTGEDDGIAYQQLHLSGDVSANRGRTSRTHRDAKDGAAEVGQL